MPYLHAVSYTHLDVYKRQVIGDTTVPSIYEVPLCFAREGVDTLILKYLRKDAPEANLTKWKELVDRCYNPRDEVHIAIVGKYVEYEDSYKSLKEALTHGALSLIHISQQRGHALRVADVAGDEQIAPITLKRG